MKLNRLFYIMILSLLVSCGSETSNTTQADPETKKLQDADAARYRELVALYVGKTVPYAEYDTIGFPDTLSGTSNSRWVAYFPKADFTIVTDKKTDLVRTVYTGKREF